ncbi:MAG TPA: hypothetical protein VGM77_11620 [Gemmatimonadales bacterium]|jgi:hypothetical protein
MVAALLWLQIAATASGFAAVDLPGSNLPSPATVKSICAWSDTTGRAGLAERESQLAGHSHQGTAAHWDTLACLRAVLAADTLTLHDGVLGISGKPWTHLVQEAALSALVIAPADSVAAELLGLFALAEREPHGLAQIASVLRHAVASGVHGSAALRACSELALQTGDNAGSRECADHALALAADSTWQLLRLARLAFRTHDTLAGSRAFLSAVAAARSSAARDDIAWHLQWFLTPEERVEWNGLDDRARPAWVNARLAERDVRDGRPAGARLAEHFKRLEFVESHFRLRGPRWLHQALKTLPAATVDGQQSGFNPDRTLVAGVSEPGSVPAAAWREYNRWQVDFDDRGVVWMRLGSPDRRIPWSCPLAVSLCSHTHVVREVWLYRVDGRVLLLDFEGEGFTGTVEATRLVVGVLGSYLCDVDAVRCALTEMSKAHKLKPEQVTALQVEDRSNVADATTHDDNSPRGMANLGVTADLHRLWDPETLAPIAMVTYALRAADLALTGAPRQRTASVNLAVHLASTDGAVRRDTTWTTSVILPDSSVKREAIVGYTIIPSTPQVGAWSFAAQQAQLRYGRSYDVMTPPLSTTTVALSDLVIGVANEGLTWRFHGTTIPLAPVAEFRRSVPMSLYYQVRNDGAAATTRATVAVYRLSTGEPAVLALQVATDQPVRHGLTESTRSLDLSRLNTGSYRIEVSIAAGSGTPVRRSTTFTLR